MDKLPWRKYVDNKLFISRNADEILGYNIDPTKDYDDRPKRRQAGLPEYLACLYAFGVLNKNGERKLFLKMNFAKKLAAKARPKTRGTKSRRNLIRLAVEARNQLIECNLRLVVSIAKSRYYNNLADFDELVSNGNSYLMRAVEGFDISRGFRFSTYATWALRHNFWNDHLKARKLTMLTTPLLDNVAVSSDISADVVKFEQLHDMAMARRRVLNTRECLVVAHRFGLGGANARTLKEVGKELRITKERARQLESRALEKLRRELMRTR